MFKLSREPLGEAVNLGFPIFLFLIAISSLIWFVVEIKRKRLELKTMIAWFVLNIIYIIVVTYVLIISILHLFYISNAPNIFNLISHYLFGLSLSNGREWIILLILAFISYILVKTLANSIKISKMDERINELKKEVAILSGKVNKTAKFNTDRFVIQKSSQEIRQELKEKVKIAKLKANTEEKLEKIKKQMEDTNKHEL